MDKNKLLLLSITFLLGAFLIFYINSGSFVPPPEIVFPKNIKDKTKLKHVSPVGEPLKTIKIELKLVGLFPPYEFPPCIFGKTRIDPLNKIRFLPVALGKSFFPYSVKFTAGPLFGAEVNIGRKEKILYAPEGWSVARIFYSGIKPFYRIFKIRRSNSIDFSIPYNMPSTIKGKVYGPDGKPISGALVWLDGKETKTNEKGEFEINDIVSGDCIIILSAEGCATEYSICPLPPGGNKKPYIFVLKEGKSIEGRVLFPRLETKELNVFLYPEHIGPKKVVFPFWLKGVTRSKRNGLFSFKGLPLGLGFRVWASGPGFSSFGKGARVKPLERGIKPDFVLVSVGETRVIRGRVLSVDCSPINKAAIKIYPLPNKYTQYLKFPGSDPFVLQRVPLAGKVVHPFMRNAVSDSNGFFEVEMAVPNGIPFGIECRKKGYFPQFIPLERIKNVEFRLLKGLYTANRSGSTSVVFRFKSKNNEILKIYIKKNNEPFSLPFVWETNKDCELRLKADGVYEIKMLVVYKEKKRKIEFIRPVTGRTRIYIKL